MGLFSKTYSPNKKLEQMKKINRQWYGLILSEQGDLTKETRGDVALKTGKWVYFAFCTNVGNDGSIIISNAACLWLSVPSDIKISESGNAYYPFPKELEKYVIKDEPYDKWSQTLERVDGYFQNKSNGWSYQWSRRPERVNQLLLGQFSEWITG